MQTIYFIMLLISISYVFFLLSRFQKHISVYYTLMTVAVVIVNLGYLQIAGAKTEEAVLLGNQVYCLAYPFLLLFTIQAIADLCKTRIPAAMSGLCICFCLLIFLGASSAGYVDWYYRSVEMVIRDGYTFLKREYGPLHLLSPIYIVLTLGYGLGIVVHALRKKKHVSYFVSVGSLCLLILCSATFLGERLAGLKIELLPIAYTVCAGGILLMLNRVATYDVKGISREAIEESREYGFVICDGKLRFSGADEQAKQWFPELNRLKIDYRIQDFSTDFLLQLKKWVSGEDSQDIVYFAREGTSAAPLHDFGKIAIPDSILNKPGKFVFDEYEIMKLHAQKGAGIVARILQNSDDLQFKNIAVNVAHYHHEKWNGTGYPCGLA